MTGTAIWREFGLGGQENQGELWKPNKTGMSMKINGMPLCDRPIKDFEEGAGWRLRARDGGKTNPTDLTCSAAIRYNDWGQNEPNAINSRSICGLQQKSARF